MSPSTVLKNDVLLCMSVIYEEITKFIWRFLMEEKLLFKIPAANLNITGLLISNMLDNNFIYNF